MGEQLQQKLDAEIELIAGSGGVLEVSVDGSEVFSKKQAGHFPTADEIFGLIA